ncbi:hypothetical protein MGYG_00434 [Nannizzia gypsea CBS 118893]|uniref:Uncharacterized protein n=1 Tax=Arthroderma gypseum (strain ATCC MYA-4604 / CBS 118893) TaxID=535722 RepID=E5QZT1_ARTGP|nr:hypothetical protein MGYG_00434 [Nannizzia gypsea CBS 118893]EFQ97394.1 hypothetical protein MGYG_00434 [Nannizzia gypsea CBS 118893]
MCLVLTSRCFLPVRLDPPAGAFLGFDPFYMPCGEICSVPLLVGLGLIKLAYQGEQKWGPETQIDWACASGDQAMTVAALLTRRDSFPLAAAPRLYSDGKQGEALGTGFSQPGTGEPQELGLKKAYSGLKDFNVQGEEACIFSLLIVI